MDQAGTVTSRATANWSALTGGSTLRLTSAASSKRGLDGHFYSSRAGGYDRFQGNRRDVILGPGEKRLPGIGVESDIASIQGVARSPFIRRTDSRMIPRRMGALVGAVVVCLSMTAAVTVAATAGAAPPGPRALAASATSTSQQEAVATYNALQQNLYVSPQSLYLGSPSNSCGTYSCLWPFANAAAGTLYLYRAVNSARYFTDVVARQTGLAHYADPSEISPTGAAQPPAYQSAVAPPLGPGGATYFDDNAWVGLNLIHAYLLTLNGTYLTLAQNQLNFIISGWDTNTTDGCPGGVFWEDVAGSQRNTTANGAGAALALELNRLTGNTSDLAWAKSMYRWVVTCLGTASGLYDDHVNPNGSVNTAIWSYNQGVMVGAGVLLYQLTGANRYLNQAQQTATAAVSYFGTGTALVNQGPAFNAIFFRNLFLLNTVAPNAAYAAEAQSFASTMWAQRQAGTGLIDPQYGVNGTAPMVEIYALLAGSSPTP
jgi:Glycosyl hydrolase family 76